MLGMTNQNCDMFYVQVAIQRRHRIIIRHPFVSFLATISLICHPPFKDRNRLENHEEPSATRRAVYEDKCRTEAARIQVCATLVLARLPLCLVQQAAQYRFMHVGKFSSI